MAIHSKVSKAKIETGVRERKAFTLNGSMSGVAYGADFPYSNSYRREVEGATYVINSYAQPVVWFKDGQWYVTDRKWSVTTTNHTSNARLAVYNVTGEWPVEA
jgi:hypothetical protein